MIMIEQAIRHLGYWLAYGDIKPVFILLLLGAIAGWIARSYIAHLQIERLKNEISRSAGRHLPYESTRQTNVGASVCKAA
jgi:hypothetical protein